MARLIDCPPEILALICKQFVLPMSNEKHGFQYQNVHSSTTDALQCRTALARLMRTCRKMHDIAGCALYSGYYHIWHTSEAIIFLRTLLDTAAGLPGTASRPESSRLELVRHADLHTNLYRDRPVEVEWSMQQEAFTDEPWIENTAAALDVALPNDWSVCAVGNRQWDHAMEHLNQLFIRSVSALTTLDVALCNNWKFELLQKWGVKQPTGFRGLLPNLRHLSLHLLSIEARSFNCHKIILEGAPNLASLEVRNSFSYVIPAGTKLLNLQTLKLVNCSMDRKSMKNVLLATPNITHFELRSVSSGRVTPKEPILAPQMLCDLLRNEYDLADPPPPNTVRAAKLQLPNFHHQLHTLVIDFHSTDYLFGWKDHESISRLRDFVQLRRLVIDTHSFAYRSDGMNHLCLTNLCHMIPEDLESLEITSVGAYCLKELVQTSLADIASQMKKDRYRFLERIVLSDCELATYQQQTSLHDIRVMFDWPGAPLVCVNGQVVCHRQNRRIGSAQPPPFDLVRQPLP